MWNRQPFLLPSIFIRANNEITDTSLVYLHLAIKERTSLKIDYGSIMVSNQTTVSTKLSNTSLSN